MSRFIRRSSSRIGQTPGTAEYVGVPRHAPVEISQYDYSADAARQAAIADEAELVASLSSEANSWINVDGVHDAEKIQRIGDVYGLHPLAVEDIAHTGQRPKVEDYETHLFAVLRMLQWNDQEERIEDEQVSLVLGKSWVLSFQEKTGDVFGPVRERLTANRGRIRKAGADYLTYALMDAVVDHYFTILEVLGDRIEDLGEDLARSPSQEHLASIRHLKRELLFMRKSVWPLREVLGSLQRDESPLIADSTRPYFRDLYDHTIQVIDTVETFRDMVAGLMDIYLSSISNRMNEVMKVLTIIATIFIPLSFIAGVYGMNFTFMPETEWRYGYFGVLGLMFAVFVGMLLYFRKKRWL